MAQALLSKCGEVLTSTGDDIEQWKDHSEELIKSLDVPSFQKAVPEISGV